MYNCREKSFIYHFNLFSLKYNFKANHKMITRNWTLVMTRSNQKPITEITLDPKWHLEN